MAQTARTAVVTGEKGGFMVTRGAPRYQYLEGRHYVVGRGKAHECKTIAEAYALRDKLLGDEAVARRAKGVIARKPPQADAARVVSAPAAPAAPVAPGQVGVGSRVVFAIAGVLQGGVVEEIGPRSLGITGDDGATYRRARGDVRLQADALELCTR